MLKRWFVLTVILASIGACSKPDNASSTKPRTFVVGMSQCNLGEPWRVQMDHDLAAAAAPHAEIKMVFKDAQNDSTRQIAQIREFIAARVDVLIVSPKEAAPLTPPIREAYEKGIPVIVLDRPIVGDSYTTFIGADNKKIGKAAGTWVREFLGGKGQIVELKGLMTSIPGQDRHSGFMDVIRDSDINVVFEADMKWLEPEARREMESALARFPQIDLVYAHNDPGAHGAYLAAKARDRHQEIKFVGIDGLPHEGRVYVKEGILAATFEYPTGGAEAIDVALKICRKEPVEKQITLGSRLFTKENVDQGGRPLVID